MTNEQGSVDRRSVLKAGLVAAGAALMAKPAAVAAATATPDDALEVLRADYRRRVERLAVDLRPRFLSGEFRGFRSGDGEGVYVGQPTTDPTRPPRWKMETEIRDREIRSEADAFLVLACSPSWPICTGDLLEDVESIAGECMGLDVYRIGLAEGWYRPEPEEEPTRAELLGLDDDAEEA